MKYIVFLLNFVNVFSQSRVIKLNEVKEKYTKEIRNQQIAYLTHQITQSVYDASKIGDTQYTYNLIKPMYNYVCNNHNIIDECKIDIVKKIIDEISIHVEKKLTDSFVDATIKYDNMQFIIDWSKNKIEI